jgi:type I restriction enzyme M protein
MLVEKYLYAGVFNPYSGVKTSILLMNRQIAAKANGILFVKVENDGFDLGAQRRMIDRNDLPVAAEILAEYRRELFAGLRYPSMLFQKMMDSGNALVVPKETIAENGEYNLTGDRYRVVERRGKQKWPMVRLGDVCEIRSGWGFPLEKQGQTEGKYPFYKASDMNLIGNENRMTISNNYIDDEKVKQLGCNPAPCGTVIFPKIGAAISTNKKRMLTRPSCYDNNIVGLVPSNINPDYLFSLLQSINISIFANSSQPPSIRKTIIEDYSIPFPPLEIQQEIVAEIEGYQKVIDGCRQVVDNWKPQVEVDPEWPVVKLGDVCELKSGFACGKSEKKNGDVLHLRPMNISSDGRLVFKDSKYIGKAEFDESYSVTAGDILFNNTNSKELVGKTCYVQKKLSNTCFSNHITRIRTAGIANPQYISFILQRLFEKKYFLNLCHKWVGQAGINNKLLSEIDIALPPLALQQEIVASTETERKIIDDCRELIVKYEEKIKKVVDKAWGE